MKKNLFFLGFTSVVFLACNAQPTPFASNRLPHAVAPPTVLTEHSVYPDFMALAKGCQGDECITQGRLLLVDKGDLEFRTDEGWNPLLWAISEQKHKLAQFLLSSGANPNVILKEKDSALSLALKHYPASEPVLNALLDARADPNLVPSESLGVSLVLTGVNSPLFKRFLDAGLDFSKSTSLTHYRGPGVYHFDGVTPLFAAAYRGELNLLKVLVKAKASVGKVNFTGSLGNRILNDVSLLDAVFFGSDRITGQKFANLIDELENGMGLKATDKTLFAAAQSGVPTAVDYIQEHLEKNPSLSIDRILESGVSTATSLVEVLNYQRLLKFKGMTFKSLAERYPGSAGGVLGELTSDIEALYYWRKSVVCTVAVVSKYFPEALNPVSPIESPLFETIGTANMRNLIHSVRNDAANLAALMVTCGADPRVKNARGQTALAVADRRLSPYLAAIEPDDMKCAKLYADYHCESAGDH